LTTFIDHRLRQLPVSSLQSPVTATRHSQTRSRHPSGVRNSVSDGCRRNTDNGSNQPKRCSKSTPG
jgi:hypothetical protein